MFNAKSQHISVAELNSINTVFLKEGCGDVGVIMKRADDEITLCTRTMTWLRPGPSILTTIYTDLS